jgi:hypothetical protein
VDLAPHDARWALRVALGRPPEAVAVRRGRLGRLELTGPGPVFSTARAGACGLIAVTWAGPARRCPVTMMREPFVATLAVRFGTHLPPA